MGFIVWSSLFPIIPLLLLACWMDGADSVVQQLSHLGLRELGVVAYLSLLSTIVGYGLWTRLLQRYAASTVAPLSLLVPVVGLVRHAAAGQGLGGAVAGYAGCADGHGHQPVWWPLGQTCSLITAR